MVEVIFDVFGRRALLLSGTFIGEAMADFSCGRSDKLFDFFTDGDSPPSSLPSFSLLLGRFRFFAEPSTALSSDMSSNFVGAGEFWIEVSLWVTDNVPLLPLLAAAFSNLSGLSTFGFFSNLSALSVDLSDLSAADFFGAERFFLGACSFGASNIS
jgi:hypothetical protein